MYIQSTTSKMKLLISAKYEYTMNNDYDFETKILHFA